MENCTRYDCPSKVEIYFDRVRLIFSTFDRCGKKMVDRLELLFLKIKPPKRDAAVEVVNVSANHR